MPHQKPKRKKVRSKAKAGTIRVKPGLVVQIGTRRVVVSPVNVLGQVGQLQEPDQDVLLEKYVRGRSSKEIAKLLRVKQRTITRRLRKAEERLGAALQDAHRQLEETAEVTAGASSLPQPESASENGTDWTKEKDSRRCELIDGEIEDTLTPEEQTELNQLQHEMLVYRRSVAPLPIEAARALHAELMEGLAKQ